MKFKRATFVIAAGAAVLIAWSLRQPPERQPASSRAAPVVETAPRAPQSAQTVRVEEPVRAAAELADAVQTADGAIHFERSDKTRIDLDARHGFGLWQPSDHELRVVLTQRALSAADQARLAETLRSDGAAGLTDTHALLELKFQPTAQAFDRNELDAAVLTVTSAAGVTVSADILGSIDWRGSLPSPEVRINGAAPDAQLVLAAAGEGYAEEDWRQSWNFVVAIPVMLAD